MAAYRARARSALSEAHEAVPPEPFQQAGRELLKGQGSIPAAQRWAAGRAKPLGHKEASSMARVAIATQRAVKAVAAAVAQEKAKLAPARVFISAWEMRGFGSRTLVSA